jgi:hypothetical protein
MSAMSSITYIDLNEALNNSSIPPWNGYGEKGFLHAYIEWQIWDIEQIIWIFFFINYRLLKLRRSSIVNDAKDPVLLYEWKSYLQEFIKPLRHITDCHHFFIDSKHPGVIKCKESVSYEPFT